MLIKVSDGLPSGGCLIGSGFNLVCERTAGELDFSLDTRRRISNLLRHLRLISPGPFAGWRQPSNNPCMISSSPLRRICFMESSVSWLMYFNNNNNVPGKSGRWGGGGKGGWSLGLAAVTRSSTSQLTLCCLRPYGVFKDQLVSDVV